MEFIPTPLVLLTAFIVTIVAGRPFGGTSIETDLIEFPKKFGDKYPESIFSPVVVSTIIKLGDAV
jgi:hypothetical protein